MEDKMLPQPERTKLKSIREQRGFALRTLAVMAGVHYTSLVRLEGGRYDPRLSTLRKIAEALEVNVCELLVDQQPTIERRK